MKSSAGGERQLTGRDPYRWRGTTEARVAGGLQPAEPYGVTGFASAAVTGEELGAAREEASPGPTFAGATDGIRQTATVRVLIAIEDRHRVYREAIGEFLRDVRPRLDVRLASHRALNGELRRFGPQIVVHGGPPVPIPDLLPCWVELSMDPSVATVFRTGRVSREVLNPSVKHLLAVIDEAAPACP